MRRRRGTLTGKDRARDGARRPSTRTCCRSDLAGARRLTYLRLRSSRATPDLRLRARHVRAGRGRRDSTLTRLQIQMVLTGSYADMRAFIHQLETAPEFVVIDNVQLARGRRRRRLARGHAGAVDLLPGRGA